MYGERVYKRRGCNACHSVDGVPKVGPTWKGIWGREETMTDGSTVKVDENYVKESIEQPNAKIVSGFGGAAMPSFIGQLDEDQYKALFAYMKTL